MMAIYLWKKQTDVLKAPHLLYTELLTSYIFYLSLFQDEQKNKKMKSNYSKLNKIYIFLTFKGIV